MFNKAEIRKAMRVQRKALSADERARASRIICDKLISMPLMSRVFEGLDLCAIYLASPNEIDLTAIITSLLNKGARVVAPRWNGEIYELARLKSLNPEDLRKGPMNILEPKEANRVQSKDIAIWLVPGLAFTKDGTRLGYGGGWYDQLMKETSKTAKKIGIAYSFQIRESLPSEPHDIRLDAIVDDSIAYERE